MSRAEKRQLLHALEERERRKRQAPLLYFNPYPKHKEFHNARNYRRRLLLGANKGGKTFAGVHEALAFIHGYRFWDVPGLSLRESNLPARDRVHRKYWINRADGVPIAIPNQGVCVTGLNTRQGIGQVIWPAFRDALPPGYFARSNKNGASIVWGPNSCPTKMTFPNGSEVFMASWEQDPMTFEGFNVQWAWVDEPVPKFVYNGLWRGLELQYGSIWFTLTPLGHRCSWMYYDLYLDGNVNSTVVSKYDNLSLSKSQIEEFERDGRFTEKEKEARMYGRFEFLGNRVFDTFDPNVHVIEDRPIPAHWIHGLTVDPHHKKPAYCVWWAVDPMTIFDPVYHFFREWPVDDYFKIESGAKSVTEYAILFREIEGKRPADVRIVDPRFGMAEWSVQGERSTCFVDLMNEAGMQFDARVPDTRRIETGITKIQEAFRWDKNMPVSPKNTPHIFIHKSCKNLITAIENIGYLDDDASRVDKLDETYKDPVDGLRYTMCYPLPIIGEELAGAGAFSSDDLRRENERW